MGANIDTVGISCQKITVNTNQIYNEGQGRGLGVCIQISLAMSNVLIEGNQLFDDQTTKTTAFTLNLFGGRNVIIKNNYIGPSVGHRINRNGAIGINKVIEGNLGYNPVGLLTSPAIPTSGVNLSNPFSFTVQVCVTGGAVSNIALNETLIGLTSGMFTLAPGDILQLGYTVDQLGSGLGMIRIL